MIRTIFAHPSFVQHCFVSVAQFNEGEPYHFAFMSSYRDGTERAERVAKKEGSRKLLYRIRVKVKPEVQAEIVRRNSGKGHTLYCNRNLW